MENDNNNVQPTQMDHYTASIELSNACREFYMTRLKATDSLKQKIQSSKTSSQSSVTRVANKTSSIQSAMDRLREEMASLMDQDLSLMKQLLTLNETIEDIKNKRLYAVRKPSESESIDELSCSENSLSTSETEICVSNEDIHKPKKINSNYLQVDNEHSLSSLLERESVSEITYIVPVQNKNARHIPQNSIDSGYGDGESYKIVMSS